jgi:hypothetical protein
MTDWLFMAIGFGGMIFSARHTKGPPSVWNPLIDIGSFVVSASLILTCRSGSWARRVGMLQFGVHLAQLTQTNK